jgi:hypothetical protein
VDGARDAAVSRTRVSIASVDERGTTLAHRGRRLGGRQPAQPGLGLREDFIDAPALDPAIVPRFERRIVDRSEGAR